MRDDLHRSIPQTSRWRRVVKLALREADRDGALPREMASVVVAEVKSELVGPCMQSLEAHFLATTQRPLFGDSFRDAVDTAEQLARAPMQFSLCETLRAPACREPIPSLPTALAEVMRQHNRNCIEQAVSHVACDKGEAEASALRKVLLAAYNHISYDDVLRGDAFPKENRDLLTHGLSLQLASTA